VDAHRLPNATKAKVRGAFLAGNDYPPTNDRDYVLGFNLREEDPKVDQAGRKTGSNYAYKPVRRLVPLLPHRISTDLRMRVSNKLS
jgi:hypothetical protein